MKKAGALWRFTRLRQIKHLNDVVEQDRRRIERLVRPGLGVKSFHTARRTIAGYEILAMVRTGQVAASPANDMPTRATFIARLFGIAIRRRCPGSSPRPLENVATEPSAPPGTRLLRTSSQRRHEPRTRRAAR